MTSSPLADQSLGVDTVDALRLLMADLQSLAERLQLKEKSRGLQQTLKATQERVAGPRAAVMLLSEKPELKRKFLERLIGPELGQVPETTSGYTRLEYGAEAEGIVAMPQGLTAVLPLEQMHAFLGRRGREMPKQAERTIRLPNPALARGLVVIDTPALDGDEPDSILLEAAASADAWVFVLASEPSLGAASRALLRRLPGGPDRLEIIVEGAESLSGEQRGRTRASLEQTLLKDCGIAEPRILFVSAAADKSETNSFWQRRLATFQSVLMLRGRERWLESTRTLVGEALTDVASEIEYELKSASLGLRQARLRLGLKDLDGLRTRFVALGQLEKERARETKPSLIPAFPEEAPLGTAGDSLPGSPVDLAADPAALHVAAMDVAAESEPPSGIPPAPMGEPTFVGFQANEPLAVARQPGLFARLLARGKSSDSHTVADAERITLPWRMAGIAVATLFACLIAWALWPRMHLPGRPAAAQWDYQPPAQKASGPASGAGANGPTNPGGELGDPVRADAGASTVQGETADSGPPASPTSLNAPPSAPPRALLPRPAPTTSAAQRARKRRHGFLGLGRVWHWIRHPAGGSHSTARESKRSTD